MKISAFKRHLEAIVSPVFILFEYDDDLRVVRPQEVIAFVAALQPWEDYDFCVFDAELNWCLALTHNGDTKGVIHRGDGNDTQLFS